MRPRIGSRPIGSITREDAANLLRSVGAKNAARNHSGGPYAAHDVRKWMRRIFNWARDHGHVEHNPFDGVRLNAQLRARDRVLSIAEVKAVLRAAATMPYPWGPIFQLIALTGARRNEWASVQRSWIDLDGGTVEWPSGNYKSRRPHVLPLTPAVASLLRTQPLWDQGPYLFSTTAGEKPVSSFSKARAALDRALANEAGAPSGDWRIHDLRRSAATHLAGLGVDEIVIERLLGHAIPGVRGIYNRYRYLDEIRSALQIWENTVRSAA